MPVAQTKQDILDLLKANAPQMRELGVRRIGLFGSFARDQQTGESDVDLLAEFEPRPSPSVCEAPTSSAPAGKRR